MYYIKHFNSENLEMRINRFMQKYTYRGLMTVVKLVIIHFHFEYIGLRISWDPKNFKWRHGALGVGTLGLKCISLQCHSIKMHWLVLQVTVTVIFTLRVSLRLSA